MVIDLFETISKETLDRVSYLANNAQDQITLRINSQGGDVFSALSIYNLLKNKCNVEIVGLAASAASMIAMAGTKIKMASNALFMIHSPKTLLVDYYDKPALDKLSSTLAKTEESIVAAYRTKVANFEMPEEELWLSAAEAQSLGFVDEILDEVPIVMDAGRTFINSIAYDSKIKGLERLHPTMNNEALERLTAMIKEQMNSGAAGVTSETLTPEEFRIKRMAAYANGVIR